MIFAASDLSTAAAHVCMWTSFVSMGNKRLGGFLGYDNYGKGMAFHDIIILKLFYISFWKQIECFGLLRGTLRSGTEQNMCCFLISEASCEYLIIYVNTGPCHCQSL